MLVPAQSGERGLGLLAQQESAEEDRKIRRRRPATKIDAEPTSNKPLPLTDPEGPELWPKVGEGVNRGRRHIVEVFEPPLLQPKERYAVSNDNVVKLIQPGILTDRLSEVLRDGARALLTQAVEAEVSEFLAATADLKTDGCRRVVRHGHLPERQILTGIGPVAVRH